MFDANFFSHFGHCQIPFDTRLIPLLSQNGQVCFCLCFDSTFTSLDLIDLPYLAPNLPADFVFFNFVAIFVIWERPDSNRGHQVPNLGAYQTGPRPLGINLECEVFITISLWVRVLLLVLLPHHLPWVPLQP